MEIKKSDFKCICCGNYCYEEFWGENDTTLVCYVCKRQNELKKAEERKAKKGENNYMKDNYLKNWYITQHSDKSVILYGDIYNDIECHFADGTQIQTSRVIKADFVNGVVETKNSVYHLEMGNENE